MNLKDQPNYPFKTQSASKLTRPILSRSTTPNVSSARTTDPKQIIPIKVEYKKPPTPGRVPRSEPPYILMRNGLTFLYTPGETERYQPSLLSMFGTPLRGSKLIGRTQAGNMFALRSNEDLRYPVQTQPRSCLTMRSKWK